MPLPPGKVKKGAYEQFALEAIVLYIGGLILLFGVSLFYLYTPGWYWVIGPQSIWFILGYSITVLGVGIVGGAAYFRHHTRKLVAGNKMFQLAFPKRYTIDSTFYPIGDLTKTDIPSSDDAALASVRNSMPGSNAQGNEVRVSMLLPGGIDYGGFKSLEPGSQGAIVLYGDDQTIDLDECVVIPYELEAMDHSEMPPEVLAKLEKNSHFSRGKTPIYTAAGLDPGFGRWLRTSPTAQSTMLSSIGYDGLVDRMMKRIVDLVAAKKLDPMIPAGRTKVPEEVLDVMRKEMLVWLQKQPALKVAMGNSNADSHYWKRRYFEAQSQVTIQDLRLRRKDHALLDAEDAFAGRQRESRAVYGNRSPEPLAAGYAAAASRPQSLPDQ